MTGPTLHLVRLGAEKDGKRPIKAHLLINPAHIVTVSTETDPETLGRFEVSTTDGRWFDCEAYGTARDLAPAELAAAVMSGTIIGGPFRLIEAGPS